MEKILFSLNNVLYSNFMNGENSYPENFTTYLLMLVWETPPPIKKSLLKITAEGEKKYQKRWLFNDYSRVEKFTREKKK